MNRLFFAALPVSAWASWAAWRGPPLPKSYATPAPLSRPVSEAAKQAVLTQMANITERIERARLKRGQPLPTHLLEASDEQGKPYIGQPIPDNPLMPGIASVQENCPAYNVRSQQDWVYCPQTGDIVPVIDGQSFSGNE